jgi:hypothetical protein
MSRIHLGNDWWAKLNILLNDIKHSAAIFPFERTYHKTWWKKPSVKKEEAVKSQIWLKDETSKKYV